MSFKGTASFILGAFAASFVLLSFLYPDLWFYHASRLLAVHDTFVSLESTFILVSYFFHGGVGLWDRFDQMNNGYFVLSHGSYGVVNILTAFIYIIFSPFFSHPAEDLNHTHLLLFYSLNCLIRIIGGYLLIRKFVSHKGALFISLVYLSTILTSYMMATGIVTQGVYSFFPLLLYFILCFFEQLRLRELLLAMLVMSLCLASSPLFTLGYFYQAVHFYILCCGAYFVFNRGWRTLRGRSPLPRVEIFKNVGLAACFLLIIMPYFWWGHALMHDFYVHASGLGGTQGRFNNIFNLSGYFHVQGKSFADPLDFLGTSLNYHQMFWGESWLFIGGSTLFFALAGMVLSRDRRKYIFLSTILIILLINTPCDYSNFFALRDHPQSWGWAVWLTLSAVTHGVNALTNPFSFLVRSFHMTSLLISMLILPLVAMGLESIMFLWQGNSGKIHFNRRWVLVILYASILLWDLSGGVNSLSIYCANQGAAKGVKEYLMSLGTIFLSLSLLPMLISGQKWFRWAILGFVFVVEFAALKSYVQWGVIDKIAPVRIAPSFTRQAVVPDYQNPRLLPLREFFNTERASILPQIYAPTCMYGAFYQFTTMGRFFNKWDLYEPRHIMYKDLYPDIEIQQYLIGNPRTIFFADYAFDSRYLGLADILRYNLGSRVVTVDADADNKPFLKSAERVYVAPMNFEEKSYGVTLEGSKADARKVAAGWEYSFDLPKDFPFYLSTSIFTYDHASWKLTVNGRLLDPMQGELTSPYTYDVQNIQTKKITILMPDQLLPQSDIKLQVKLPDRILGVWKNTYDDLGLTYEAPKDGWLVFNYPYDEKWELSIDGRKTPISKVNRCFFGAPVTGGKHQVLLRYWPHTSLRSWIFISMVMSTICFLGILFYGIKREPLYQG